MKPKGSQFSLFDASSYDVKRFDTNVAAPKPSRGPFSGKSAVVTQESLPAGMPVSLGTVHNRDSYEWGEHYEWVPTWEVSTSQNRVRVYDLNQKHNNPDFSRLPQTEGQEGEAGMNSVGSPLADKHPNGYRLADGNHRITAERHKGAMFHRLLVRGESSKPIMPADSNYRADGARAGRYDP